MQGPASADELQDRPGAAKATPAAVRSAGGEAGGRLRHGLRLIDPVMLGAGTAIGASIFTVLGPADLNVIDIDRLTLDAPSVVYDLPGGGRRLLQTATGYVATIVAGKSSSARAPIRAHGPAVSSATPGGPRGGRPGRRSDDR
jgi:hypothetical protein